MTMQKRMSTTMFALVVSCTMLFAAEPIVRPTDRGAVVETYRYRA